MAGQPHGLDLNLVSLSCCVRPLPRTPLFDWSAAGSIDKDFDQTVMLRPSGASTDPQTSRRSFDLQSQR